MPAVSSVDKEKLDLLYGDTVESVVSLLRYSKETQECIDFASGFVLHDDGVKAVIVTSSEVFDEDEEDIFVCFSDGQTQKASVFINNVDSVYMAVVVDSTSSGKPVTFRGTLGRGELVFTLTRVLEKAARPGIFTGSVIHPRCQSVNIHTGKPVSKHNNLFALNCPVAGPCNELKRCAAMFRLVGAPVFNFKSEMVGVMERCSPNKYDLKFARLTDSVNELQILFGRTDWMAALEIQLKNKTSK